MFLADDAVHAILEFYCRSGGSFEVGLTLDTPGEDPEALAGLTEPTATAYARVTLNRDAASWTAPADRRTATTGDLQFPDPDGTEDWGVIHGWVLFDTGTPVMASRLADAVEVLADSTNVTLPAGSVFIYAPATLY